MSEYILDVTDVDKNFGGLRALSDINLRVKEGTVHAIIGPNGAGTVSYTHLTLPTNREV